MGRNEKIIVGRIEERRCTRGEWLALYRLRRMRRFEDTDRGDPILQPVLMQALWLEAARPFVEPFLRLVDRLGQRVAA